AAAPAPNSRTIDGSGTSTPELDPLLLEDELELLDELLLEELLDDEELLLLELLDVLEVMLPEVDVVVRPPELDDDELDEDELLQPAPNLPFERHAPVPEQPDGPHAPREPEPPLLTGSH